MNCQSCGHDLADHSPDSAEIASHSCDTCECEGFVGPQQDGFEMDNIHG